MTLKDSEQEERIPQATMQPFPSLPSATLSPQVIYENYDTKYNVYDKEPEPKPPVPGKGGSGGSFHVTTEAATPGTVLVIGIIAGAIIAVILIVIIVLKVAVEDKDLLVLTSSSLAVLSQESNLG